MNILILGTTILAVNPFDTGDHWATAEQIIPKHVVSGAQIVDAALPSDYAAGKYSYANGVFTLLPDTPEVAAQKVGQHNSVIDAQILALESTQHRTVREAALNQPGAVGRLTALDTQIATLRGQRQ